LLGPPPGSWWPGWGPAWLAVALFMAIPGGYGALAAWLVEVFSSPGSAKEAGLAARWWRSTPVTVLGTTLFWVLVAWGSYGLVADVVSIASDRASAVPFTL
jgi:hypothetical protein